MNINAADVKRLREKTGSGFMDCKRALEEADGDLEEAQAILRKKGISVAAKRAERAATEGAVAAYIHGGGRIGVLVEINCETDFVARTDQFQELCKNIAMQVAASKPRWVSREDVPEDALEKERQILVEQAKGEGKPEHIAEKMVEGRLKKFYTEFCLMEQPYIRDETATVQDLVNDFLGQVGEKVAVRRFTRYALGEEI